MPSLAGPLTQPNDVPVQGLPGRRLGGGTRNPEGYIEQMPLVALIPETNLGITTAAYPQFLFYLPAANEIRDVEFVLYNEADDLVYETTVSVAPTAGIFSMDLAEVAPLQLNKNYHWYFSIIADDRAQDMSVDGWTRRVELSTWIQEQSLDPSLALRLETAAPLERVRLLYQEAQLWHDAAVMLEDLQQTTPNSRAIAEEWNHLLQAVNLSELDSASMHRVSVVNSRDNANVSSMGD